MSFECVPCNKHLDQLANVARHGAIFVLCVVYQLKIVAVIFALYCALTLQGIQQFQFLRHFGFCCEQFNKCCVLVLS